MSPTPEEEPLLPPWVMAAVVRIGPVAVVFGLYFLLTSVLHLPGKILAPAMALVAIGVVVYIGGRFYKPFHVDKTGRCVAKGASERRGCRHYMPGAKLGGGCGRQKDNGQCRVVR